MNTLCPKLTKLESWLVACLSPLLIIAGVAFAIFPQWMLGDLDHTDGSVAILLREFVPAPIVSFLGAWAAIAAGWRWWQAVGRLAATGSVFCFGPTGIEYSSFKQTRHYRWEEFDHILLHEPHYLRLTFRLKSETAPSLGNLIRKLLFVSRIPPLNEADTKFEFEPILEHLDKYAPREILH